MRKLTIPRDLWEKIGNWNSDRFGRAIDSSETTFNLAEGTVTFPVEDDVWLRLLSFDPDPVKAIELAMTPRRVQ